MFIPWTKSRVFRRYTYRSDINNTRVKWCLRDDRRTDECLLCASEGDGRIPRREKKDKEENAHDTRTRCDGNNNPFMMIIIISGENSNRVVVLEKKKKKQNEMKKGLFLFRWKTCCSDRCRGVTLGRANANDTYTRAPRTHPPQHARRRLFTFPFHRSQYNIILFIYYYYFYYRTRLQRLHTRPTPLSSSRGGAFLLLPLARPSRRHFLARGPHRSFQNAFSGAPRRALRARSTHSIHSWPSATQFVSVLASLRLRDPVQEKRFSPHTVFPCPHRNVHR